MIHRRNFLMSVAALALAPAIGPSADLSQPGFEFQNEIVFNLHHTLYNHARVQALVDKREKLSALDHVVQADMNRISGDDWAKAVAIYRHLYGNADFVFDDALSNADSALAAKRAEIHSALKIPAPMVQALKLAMPAYEDALWPEHDRQNRPMLIALAKNAAVWNRRFGPRLAQIYQTAWLREPYLVNVVRYSDWAGSYCNNPDGFTNIVMSSGDPDQHDLGGIDVLFHEASHSIVDPYTGPIARAINREAAKLGKKPPENFWHALIMYTPGKLAEEWFSNASSPHTMVWIRMGLFTRVWPTYYQALERHWFPYMKGATSLDPAIAGCMHDLLS